MLSRPPSRFVITLLLSACAVDSADHECLPGRPCRVVFEHVATVGSDDGPGSLVHDGPVMSRLADGRFVIFDPRDRIGLKLYDANGAFLRIIGRSGGGPGEYSLPWHHELTKDGDTLRIIEGLSRRTTLLTPDGDSVLATRPFGVSPALQILFLDDGRYIANGLVVESDGLGYPLHLVAASGERVRSFGADEPVYTSSDEAGIGRRLAPGPDGTIWVAHRMTYTVEQWDSLGNLVRRIEPASVWFPDPNDARMPLEMDDGPPPHLVTGVWYEDGVIWLATQVPSPNWRDRLEQISDVPGIRQYRLRSPQINLWMTRVEAIDAATGEVLAAGDHPDGIYDMLTDGHIYTISLNDWDIPFAEVWRLRLAGS